jgi:hypothetical protein
VDDDDGDGRKWFGVRPGRSYGHVVRCECGRLCSDNKSVSSSEKKKKRKKRKTKRKKKKMKPSRRPQP